MSTYRNSHSRGRRRFQIFAAAVLFFLAGCAWHAPDIDDLSRYPQVTRAYLADDADRPLANDKYLDESAERYLALHFSPWDDPAAAPSPDSIVHTIEQARSNPGYGENRLPHEPAWIECLVSSMNLDNFPALSLPAITLHETSLRGFPTERPRFLHIDRPGGGFPFDYWQESLLFANTPLRIIHVTRTGEWLYVRAPFVSGWVRTRDVGTLCGDDLERFRSGTYLVTLRDRVSLQDSAGRFIFQSRIGGIYPHAGTVDQEYQLLVAVPAGGSKAILDIIPASPRDFAPFPLTLTARTVARTADAMAGSPYGWGGLYGNRDCSSFLRDLFSCFGLWLPRNSYQQIQADGGPIALAHLLPHRKEQLIIDEGIPFATLLWMPGHVLLYIGEKEGAVMAAHVLWGVHSHTWRGEGRIIVGGMAVTTLRPGEKSGNVRPNSLIINRIEGMRHLVPRNITNPRVSTAQ